MPTEKCLALGLDTHERPNIPLEQAASEQVKQLRHSKQLAVN
jgi:hypothetical protein